MKRAVQFFATSTNNSPLLVTFPDSWILGMSDRATISAGLQMARWWPLSRSTDQSAPCEKPLTDGATTIDAAVAGRCAAPKAFLNGEYVSALLPIGLIDRWFILSPATFWWHAWLPICSVSQIICRVLLICSCIRSGPRHCDVINWFMENGFEAVFLAFLPPPSWFLTLFFFFWSQKWHKSLEQVQLNAD